jgi:hypothetical protein
LVEKKVEKLDVSFVETMVYMLVGLKVLHSDELTVELMVVYSAEWWVELMVFLLVAELDTYLVDAKVRWKVA